MREHTVTTIRSILSTGDSEVLTALKDEEQHKNRLLTERVRTKAELIHRFSDPTKIFTKDYWREVAELMIKGKVDPANMEPLFSPRAATALEKMARISPGPIGAAVKGLRGLKKLKGALTRPKHGRSIFDEPEVEAPIGSEEYFQAKEIRTRRVRGHGSLDVKPEVEQRGLKKLAAHYIDPSKLRFLRNLGTGGTNTITIPVPANLPAGGRSQLPVLQKVIHDKLSEFGNVRKLANTIAALRKR